MDAGTPLVKLVHCAVIGALLLPAVAAANLRDDLSAAQALYQSGDRAAAKQAYGAILDRHGDEGDARAAYYYMALLSTDGLDYIKYLDAFLEHGGRKDRRGAEVELRAGRFYFTEGDYRTALRRFESARDLAKGDDEKRETAYWVGLALVALQEFPDARDNLKEAAAPGGALSEAALFALGELERSAGDYGAAAAAYANVLSAFPRGDYAPAALLGEATARELLGEPSAARPLLARLLADFPETPAAATARGRLAAVGGTTEERPTATAGGEPPAPEAGYLVQVGAFAQEANARKLADDLTRLGYDGVRIERGTERDRLYHVRFGPFADQTRAERAGEQVSATLGLRYQLVPPEDTRP